MEDYGKQDFKKVEKTLFGCQECKRRKIKCSDNANGYQQNILKTLPPCIKCVKANKEHDCVYLDMNEQKLLRKIRKLLRNFAKDEDIDNRDIIKDYIRGEKSLDALQQQVDALIPKAKKQKVYKSPELIQKENHYSPEIFNDNFDWKYGMGDLMKFINNIGLPDSSALPDLDFGYNNQFNSFTNDVKPGLPVGENDENHAALEVDFLTENMHHTNAHKHVRREIKWKQVEQVLLDIQNEMGIDSTDLKNFYNFYHNVSYWIFPFDKTTKGKGTVNYIVFDYILNKLKNKNYRLLKDPLVLIILALTAEYTILIEKGTQGDKGDVKIQADRYANTALQILNSIISNLAKDERLLKANIGSLTITILLIVIYTSSENGGGWKEHHLAAKVIYQKYLLALAKDDDNSSEDTSSSSDSGTHSVKQTMSLQEENLFKLFKLWFPAFDLLASTITAERGVLKTAEYDYLFRENFDFLNEKAVGTDTENCEGCLNYDVTAEFYCVNDKGEIYNTFEGHGDCLTNLLVKLLDYIRVEEKLKNPDLNAFYDMMKDLTVCREFCVRKSKNGLLLDQKQGEKLYEQGESGILKINNKFYSIYDMSHLMHTELVNVVIFQKFNIGDVNLNGFIRQNILEMKGLFGQLFIEKTEMTKIHYENAYKFYEQVMQTGNNEIKILSEKFFESPSSIELLEFHGSLSYNLLMLFACVQMYALSLTPEIDGYIEERMKVIGYCQVLHTQVGSIGGLSSCLNFIKVWKGYDENPYSYKSGKNLKSLSDKSVPFI